MTIIHKFIIGICIVIASWFFGYHTGQSNQKTVYVAQQAKANEKMVEKNDKMQEAADKEVQIQIVYKDRIITKYQTIEKEIIKYEKTPAANVSLDDEFVRLHDAAAGYGEAEIAASAFATDGTSPAPQVTTGDAISVIADNYQSYYECKAKIEGWQRYYADLQKTLSD